MLRNIALSIALITCATPSIADPHVDFRLAIKYQDGADGMPQDMSIADTYFVSAAKKGHVISQYITSNIKMENGDVVDAYAWLLSATQCGLLIPIGSKTLSEIALGLSGSELELAVKHGEGYKLTCSGS